MADKIQLGVDVDTRTVKTADKDMANLGKRADAVGRSFDQMAKGADRAEKELVQTTRATQQSERAIANASRQMQGMMGSMRGVAGLGGAVRAALAGFVGASIIRGLMDTATQMQRINMTLTAVTGSSEAAAREFQYVSDTADKFGQSVQVAAGAYSKLLAASSAAGISLQDSRNVFEGLTAAATTFGLSQYELEGALNAVQQMISKGSVQAEELRGQLGERLPGAFAIAAESMGMTTQELNKALEQGKVSAIEFVQAFGPELQKRFGGMAASSDTATKRLNELDNAFFKLKNTIIESGFMDAMISVLQTLTAFVQLDAVVAMANGIGRAFKFMADNVVLAAAALAGMAVAFGWVGPAVAAITAVVAAFGYLSTKTIEVEGQMISFGDIAGRATSILRDEVVQDFQDMQDALTRYEAAHPPTVIGISNDLELIIKALRVVNAGYAGMEAGTTAALQTMVDNAQVAAQNIATRFRNLGSALKDMGAALLSQDWGALWEAVSRPLNTGTVTLKNAGTAAAEAWTGAFEETINKPIFIETGGGVLGALRTAAQELAAENKRDILREHQDREAGYKDRIKNEKLVAAEAGKTDKAGAKAAANALERARDILDEQMTAYQHIRDQLKGVSAETGYVVDETKKLVDALDKSGLSLDGFLQTVGMTRDAYTEMLRETEKMTAQLEHQKKAGAELVTSLRGLAFGTMTGAEGVGGAISALTEGSFGADLDKAFEDAGKTLADTFSKAMSGISGRTGLSGFGASAIGTGIGIAAAGALNGNAEQIGGGIGSAIGGAVGGKLLGSMIGAAAGPIGMVLGGLVGSFMAKGLGGGNQWSGVSGAAFTGTTYSQDVSVRVKEQEGANANARLAVEGTLELVRNFNAELVEYVKAAGGTMRAGTMKVRDEFKVLKAITGVSTYYDVSGVGPEADAKAEEISIKVSEIMALAGTIAQKAAPALTQAQQLWREAQKRFSAENVAILRDLGFSVAEIMAVKNRIKADLRQGFNAELLSEIASSGKATARELGMWRDDQLAQLQKARQQAMATAHEIGGSTTLVASAFRARALAVVEQYRDLLDDLTGATEEVVFTFMDRVRFRLSVVQQTIGAGTVTPGIASLQRYDQLKVLEDQRKELLKTAREMGFVNTAFIADWFRASRAKINRDFKDLIDGLVEVVEKKVLVVSDRQREIIQQAEAMAEGLRNAAKSLADVRAGLKVGQESPLGLEQRLAAARQQFTLAAGRARGGDVGAAGEVGNLAQVVLQLGRQVYGSSTGYASLFGAIDATLGALGVNLNAQAKTLENKLQEDILKGQTKQTDVTKAGFVELSRKLDGVISALERQARANRIANAKAAVA